MSLNEFYSYLQGYHDRVDMGMDMLAWHASVTLAPHTKKGKSIDPSALRGKKPKNIPSSGAEVLEVLRDNADKADQDAFWKKGRGREWQKQT